MLLKIGRPSWVGQRIDIVLRMWHEADDIPSLVTDARNVVEGPGLPLTYRKITWPSPSRRRKVSSSAT